MKIECLLRELNGSLVPIEDKKYDFQPNDAGDHVCIVTNVEHRALLLAVPEAFRVYGEVEAAKYAADALRKVAEEAKEGAVQAAKAAKEAEALANKAIAKADAEEKRINDEVALEQERERERVEAIAKAKQRLQDERRGNQEDDAILKIMKENPEFNEDDAKKQYLKEQVSAKGRKAA